MATHMVRVLCEPPKGGAETAISNWVSNYNEWTADPTTHELVETNTAPDGSGTQYVRGDWRFVDQGEDPTNILSDLSGRLQSIQDGLWHRLGYHICDHHPLDEPNSPCTWDETVEWGTVPSDIPTFEVTA